jgi:membrane associated rhomboid family serine protease
MLSQTIRRVLPALNRASEDPPENYRGGDGGGGDGGGGDGGRGVGGGRDIGGPGDPGANAPIFNLPPMVGRLIGLNVAVHAARYFITDDDTLVETLGFLPARYGGGFDDGLTGFGWTALVAPLTYQFLHGGVAHLVLNMVSLAAFGTAVERRLGSRRMLTFYLLTGLIAALVHWASDPASINPVIGASGAISGVFAGTLLLLRELGQFGSGRRQLFLIIGLWLAMTVLTGSGAPPGSGGAPVAWIAHIGGFLAGLALWPLFSRRGR